MLAFRHLSFAACLAWAGRGLTVATLALVCLGSGCVMIDSKVKETKPAPVSLVEFSGDYSGKAAYASKNALGWGQDPELASYLRFDARTWGESIDRVRVSFDGKDTLTFLALREGKVIARAVLREKTDFTFADGVLSLNRKGGVESDAPAIGVGTKSTRLFLDEKLNLTIAEKSAGMGLLLVVPVASVGSGMLTFPRLAEAPAAPDVAGFYELADGGFSEELFLELRKDGSYELNHVFVSDVIGPGVASQDGFAGKDTGRWSLSAGVVTLQPEKVGTERSPMFLPAHCVDSRWRRLPEPRP